MSAPVILFDGVCNLCNSSVQFIIRHDKKALFRFAALQSEAGKALQLKFGLDPAVINTIVLVQNDRVYTRSEAVLRVARQLGGMLPLAYVFIIVPAFIRDAVYRFVGNNRYRWFGKKESCMLPTPALKARFL